MLKPTPVLTSRQLDFLKALSRTNFVDAFYLTGGTALCGFYLPYRYSEDLDFFSQDKFDLEAVSVFVKSIQKDIGFKSFDVQTSFNRNLVFLEFTDETFKTEFTYFPFPQKNKPKKYQGVLVDSLEDIALNKLFTIYQRPRLRDFMDLYAILQAKNYGFEQLVLDSKAKFDWHIDRLQLGSQILKVGKRKDAPRLVEDSFDYTGMEQYFRQQAARLGGEIVKNG